MPVKLQKYFEFTGKELYFQGHFPGAPILPGVMQLQFAHQAAEEMLGRELTLKAVKKMKFVKVIEPSDRISVELDGDEGTVAYTIRKGDEICSSGVLSY